MFKVWHGGFNEWVEFELITEQVNRSFHEEKWMIIADPINGHKTYGEQSQELILELLNMRKFQYIEKMLREQNGFLYSNLIVHWRNREDAEGALEWIESYLIMEKILE